MPGPGQPVGAFVVGPRQAALACVVAGLLWTGIAGSAQALNLTVDTTIDTTSAQACTGNNPNDCSLRGAILAANAVIGPHVITVPAGTYTQVLLGAGEDAGQTGDWDIKQAITINGAGGGLGSPTATIFTGDATKPLQQRDRLFHVLPGGNLTLRDVRLQNGGNGPNFAVQIRGGGAYAQGPLTLERVFLFQNSTARGAGAEVEAATTIRDSTFSSNVAAGGGGGIEIFPGPMVFNVSIENTTFRDNDGGAFGGGIWYSEPLPASMTLNNVTIANNRADVGGGIHIQGSAPLIVRNTLIAENTGREVSPNCQDFDGRLVSQGYNLVFGGDTCGLSAGNQDQVNTGDPKIGALFESTGSTGILPLSYASAAIDRGNPAPPGSGGNACVAVDQRGIPRTLDGDGDGIGRCDVGAAEGGRWLPVDTTSDDNALQSCDSITTNGQCSLRGAITVARNLTDPIVITLPATGAGNPYRLTMSGAEDENSTGDLDVSNDVTIVGGGAATTIVDGNQVDRAFHVPTISNPATYLRLQDLTVQNGNAGAGSGGGIFTEQKPVSLLRVRLRANTAQNGGGIFFLTTSGGISDSVLSDNQATGTILGGGGIAQSTTGTVQIRNSTIAQNQSGAGGGGIVQFGSVTTVLRNVTVAENSAEASAGIHVTNSPTAGNSIVANNRLLHPTLPNPHPNCGGSGTFNSDGYNLVFGGDACGFGATGDKQNQNPQLQALALNGGTTETMALGPGSAATDAGNPAPPNGQGTACFATDQRGTARPVDGDAVGGGRCDIGAYEAAFCTTRPGNVTTGVAPGSPGRLAVTVKAGFGNIKELRLHATPSTNIQVSIGALVNQSGELTVPINAPTAQFTVRRASGSGTGTLPFDVVDDCSTWKTLAGGGPRAWPAGSSAVDEGPAEDTQRTAPAGTSASTATTDAPPSAPTLPSATPVIGPASCAPRRPDVGVSTVKSGPGQLRATLTAQTLPGAPPNSLLSIRIGSIANADVTLNGAPVTAGQAVTLPDGAREATLMVTRRGAAEGPNPTSGVSFVVTDDCGEWGSFVGGGAGAF